jgi:hypothetical protein
MTASATRAIPDPVTEPTITVARAVAIAGVGLSTGYDAIERGDWPSVRTGRAIRVPTGRWLVAVGLADEEANG